MISCAAASYLIDKMKSPFTAVASCAVSFGLVWLITNDVSAGAVSASSVFVIGLLFALCKRSRAGFFRTSLVIGTAILAATAISVIIYLQTKYSDVIGGAKEEAALIYNNVIDALNAQIEAYGATPVIPANVLEEVLSFLARISPGIIAASFEVAGAAAFLVVKLFYRVASKRPDSYKGEYAVPPTAVIFFAASVLLTMIFSLFSSLEIAEIASINMCLALGVPTLFDGAMRLVDRIKNPPTVTLPDGREVKRPATLLIVALAVSFFVSFIVPVFFIAFYSVTGTVKDLIKNKKQSN